MFNWGKQKPARFFQLKLKASTFRDRGWGNHFTKRGSCRLHSDAKSSTLTSHIDWMLLNAWENNIQSPEERGRRDSANLFKTPGTKRYNSVQTQVPTLAPIKQYEERLTKEFLIYNQQTSLTWHQEYQKSWNQRIN
jgi:hypothetical protein